MGKWIKRFVDGSHEVGSDEKIAKREASWSRGRLDGIREVRLCNIKRAVELSVPNTSWHQFDRFIVAVAVGTQKPQVTHRVVQAEIKSHHVGQHLVCSGTGENTFWAIVQDPDKAKENHFSKPIREHHVGKWITVILPENDYPAMTFSTKGKMNDNQHISRQRN